MPALTLAISSWTFSGFTPGFFTAGRADRPAAEQRREGQEHARRRENANGRPAAGETGFMKRHIECRR